jgi:hypothetical protein
MSWAEVKKINSDLTTPINIADLINHIDLVGPSYIGYSNLDTTKQILNANGLYSHRVALDNVSDNFWNYILNYSTTVGLDLDDAFKLQNSTIRALTTVAQVLGNPTHAQFIGKNTKAMLSLMHSAYFQIVINYAGMITGLLSNALSVAHILDYTRDQVMLPVVKIRAATTCFNEMHNATNLVKLTTVGAGTYVVPDGVYSLLVITMSGGGCGNVNATGGNGGGGGGAGGVKGGTDGGGGGGGAYAVRLMEVTPNQNISYVVGAGGTTASRNGVATTFNSIGGTIIKGDQRYTIPNLGDGGGGLDGGAGDSTGRGGDGGGGVGGGNGATGYRGTRIGGTTYGTIGGGSSEGVNFHGSGGVGFGGGGGGSRSGYGSGGAGGQGAIALYLGKPNLVL